jgi:hypothetical protein
MKTDYSKGLIYKLCCKDPEITDIYVGSTTNFEQRKNNHNYRCYYDKSKKFFFKVYKFIREHGGFENWKMEIIEYYPCKTKKELSLQERYYIDTLKPSLNSYVPTRTVKEYCQDNKQHKSEYMKKRYSNKKNDILKKNRDYYENNKEKLNEINKQPIICKCGCILSKVHIKRHERTKKHMYLLDNLFLTENY